MNLLLDLLEALKPSQYRELVKGWDKNRYEALFRKYTNDRRAFRIYIPFKGTPKKVKPDPEVEEVVKAAGYEIVDYVAGIAEDKTGRQLKIGKILARANASKEVVHTFTVSPKRAAARKIENYVVISRHPYDIAGMSTDRGWRSCMNLKNGENRHYVPIDIKEGTIVAYFVNESDKNINSPIARVLIKPFIQEDDKGNIKATVLGVEDRVYGTAPEEFRETVVKWVDEVNEASGLDGIFHFHPDLYNDGGTKDYMGVGPTGKQYQLVRDDWRNIEKIDNPGEDLVELAIKKSRGAALELVNKVSFKNLKVAFAYFHNYHWDKKQTLKMVAGCFQHLKKIGALTDEVRDYVLNHESWLAVVLPDLSEEDQKKMINHDYRVIQSIPNPSTEILKYAIDRNSFALSYIVMGDHQSDEIYKYAIDKVKTKDDVDHLVRGLTTNINRDRDIAPEHVWLYAIKHVGKRLADEVKEHISPERLTPDVRVELTKLNPYYLMHVPGSKRTPALEKSAVEAMPESIQYISKPSEELQLIAVNKDPTLIKLIQEPTDEAVKVALEKDPSVLRYIHKKHHNDERHHKLLDKLEAENGALQAGSLKNPSEAVMLRVVQKRPTEIAHFRDAPLSVQKAAIEKSPDSLIYIQDPGSEIFEFAISKIIAPFYIKQAVKKLTDKNVTRKIFEIIKEKLKGHEGDLSTVIVELRHQFDIADDSEKNFHEIVHDDEIIPLISSKPSLVQCLKEVNDEVIKLLLKNQDTYKVQSALRNIRDWKKVSVSTKKMVLRKDGGYIRFLNDEDKKNESLFIVACEESPWSWEYWDGEDPLPEKIVLAAIKGCDTNDMSMKELLDGLDDDDLTPKAVLKAVSLQHDAVSNSLSKTIKRLSTKYPKKWSPAVLKQIEETADSKKKAHVSLTTEARRINALKIERLAKDDPLAKKCEDFKNENKSKIRTPGYWDSPTALVRRMLDMSAKTIAKLNLGPTRVVYFGTLGHNGTAYVLNGDDPVAYFDLNTDKIFVKGSKKLVEEETPVVKQGFKSMLQESLMREYEGN